jgi:hypothetical protein
VVQAGLQHRRWTATIFRRSEYDDHVGGSRFFDRRLMRDIFRYVEQVA